MRDVPAMILFIRRHRLSVKPDDAAQTIAELVRHFGCAPAFAATAVLRAQTGTGA